MALPDYAAQSVGTAIILADTTDHSPAANYNLGTRTDQIDCTDLAAAAARQSAKFDFGSTWDLEFVLASVVEWETTPEVAAGETLDFYMGYSHSATAAVGNPANLSGADAAYTGITGGTLANSLKQLTYIGSQVMDNVINTDMPQVDTNVATFTPRDRYGILVVFNNAASAALHSDMVETSFRLTPIRTSIID
jgi:hypothetical protein